MPNAKPSRDRDDPNAPKQPIIDVDAGTLLAIVAALILLPLLLTGFFANY
jgi:hypothetical protein